MSDILFRRWHVLSPYLDQALELPHELRDTWLAWLRTRDAQLADELRDLLDEYDLLQREGFLEQALDFRVVAPPEPHAIAPGEEQRAPTIEPLSEDHGRRDGPFAWVWVRDHAAAIAGGLVLLLAIVLVALAASRIDELLDP